MHRLTRTWLVAAVGAGAVLTLGLACGTRNLTDGASSGADPAKGAGSDCAPGRAGCPCDVPGQTFDCGTEVSRSGDYVMCSMGTSTCQNGVWGACRGGNLQAQSIAVSRIDGRSRHVRNKVVSCPQTIDGGSYFCDPNRCPPVVESAGDVDAGGFTEGDGTVSLAPATSITGRVFDPAGKNPVNNVSVYIPTAALPPFVQGPTCNPCSYAGGAPPPTTAAATQTAPDGTFTLTNVPSGANIPIVVQTGKWRRKITLANVTPLVVNHIPDGTLHLPRNQTDGDNGQADLPKIAFVSGGGPDDLECLLLKMGLDPNEFGSLHMNSNRRLHYYESPDKPGTPLDPAFGEPNLSGQVLWTSAANLALYDLVILACDGSDYTDNGRVPTGDQYLTNYANGGGRVFLSHLSRSWMMFNAYTAGGPAWDTVTAGWGSPISLGDPLTATIVTSTPRGQALAQWLTNVNAISAPDAGLVLHTAKQSSSFPLSPNVQMWMTAPGWGGVTYSPNYSFNTPFGATAGDGGTDGGAGACGEVVFADYHVSSADILSSPTSCSTSAQCGYASTCQATGGLAACNAAPCYPTTIATNCAGAPKYTCSGATMGTCACNVNADCQAVNGGTCVNGNCSQATCYANSDCPSGPLQCNGSTLGSCTPNSCMTDADCTKGHCLNGKCNGCYTAVDCPGAETCSSNGANVCTGNGANVPYACAQLPMTPQESALEFEILDLGACTVPVTPVATSYAPASFTEDLVSSCATGQIPVWRELDWYASVPNTSSISFYAQTAAPPADGGAPDWTQAELVPVYTATTSTLPPGPPARVPIDVGPGGPIAADAAPIDASTPGAFQLAMPPVSSLADLRLTIKMTPTTNMTSTPTLYNWTVKWDCMPTE
jgi:hypothetical protein